jgi:uncharacterized protein YqgC (DUF456 family)
MTIVWACVLFLVILVGWALGLFGLPGNWFNAIAVAGYAFFMPADQRVSISWWVVGTVFALAVLGEVIEAVAGAAGAAQAGGSRRAMVLGVAGSFIGGIVGAFVGLPVPVVGSVVAILLFASLGALAGAVVGERWKGRDWESSWKVGEASFWGRLLGTVGKLMVGAMIVVVVLAALVFA